MENDGENIHRKNWGFGIKIVGVQHNFCLFLHCKRVTPAISLCSGQILYPALLIKYSFYLPAEPLDLLVLLMVPIVYTAKGKR